MCYFGKLLEPPLGHLIHDIMKNKMAAILAEFLPRTGLIAINGQASSDKLPTNDSHRTTGKTIILYNEGFKPRLMKIETPIIK